MKRLCEKTNRRSDKKDKQMIQTWQIKSPEKIHVETRYFEVIMLHHYITYDLA